MSYFAGFDFSSADAVFSVTENTGKILFDRALSLPGRDASSLPGWMRDLLLEQNLTFTDIDEWSVGAGPGSFTGLRLSASLVMGLTFRREVKTRAVSSAAALAHSLFDISTPVLAVYDGRKNELLAFGLKPENGFFTEDGFRAEIQTDADLCRLLEKYPRIAALRHDREAVAKIAPRTAENAVTFAESICGAALSAWRPGDFSRPLTDLAYLRPAVFVEPSPIRTGL